MADSTMNTTDGDAPECAAEREFMNLAGHEFGHILSARYRISPANALELPAVLEALAQARGSRERVHEIKQGNTTGAYINRGFAHEVLGQAHLVLAEITRCPTSAHAFLVLRGFVDHCGLAHRLVGLCFNEDPITFHNTAGVELAQTVAMPSEVVLQRMRGGRPVIRRGNVLEHVVLDITLRLPGQHRPGATLRVYSRRNDPNHGVLRIEVSTSRFGAADVERAFLRPTSTAGLRAIMFAAHEVMDRYRRKYGLQVVAMPLSYKGFPVIWLRQRLPNLIRQGAPAGMFAGQLIAPSDGSVLASGNDTYLVTEAGVPIFLNDDDDERLLRRLACYLPIQDARFRQACRQFAIGRLPATDR